MNKPKILAHELRTLAGELRRVYEHSTDWLRDEAVTLASSVDSMREAADTIEGLRDRLQDAEDVRFDAGFDNGMKAVLQQLDGLIHEGADVDEIQGWIDRQWEEEV